MRCRRGRYRCARRIENIPAVTFYETAGGSTPSTEVVELSYVELEAIRLIDLEKLTQEQAATRMGISRRSFWTDLASARWKIAHALVNGHAIRMVGGHCSGISRGNGNQGGKENAKI